MRFSRSVKNTSNVSEANVRIGRRSFQTSRPFFKPGNTTIHENYNETNILRLICSVCGTVKLKFGRNIVIPDLCNFYTYIVYKGSKNT